MNERPAASPHALIPGLDGLRALAVAVVFVSHLPIAIEWLDYQSWFGQFRKAGFLGVNMFFVLSGFLITHRLLETRRSDGRFAVRRFTVTRFARIMPAVTVFLAVHAVYAVIQGYPPFGRARDEVIMIVSTILQFANYAILSDIQLLEENGALWSLSVEGHFYIVWPLVMWALFRLLRGGRAAMWILFAMVPLLYGWTAWIFADRGYLSAYLRTDARIVSMVTGAATAVLWSRSNAVSPMFLRTISVPALVAMAVIHSVADGWEPFIWDGGMALFDVCTAIVILAMATGNFPLLALFTTRTMRWVGTVSYGVYIWQIPVLTLLDRHAADWNQVAMALMAVAATVALGAASYYFVEQPVRRSRLVQRLAG